MSWMQCTRWRASAAAFRAIGTNPGLVVCRRGTDLIVVSGRRRVACSPRIVSWPQHRVAPVSAGLGLAQCAPVKRSDAKQGAYAQHRFRGIVHVEPARVRAAASLRCTGRAMKENESTDRDAKLLELIVSYQRNTGAPGHPRDLAKERELFACIVEVARAIALRILRSKEDALEVAQDTAEALVTSLRREKVARPIGLIATIATREALNRIRSRKVRAKYETADGETLIVQAAGAGSTPEELVGEREQADVGLRTLRERNPLWAELYVRDVASVLLRPKGNKVREDENAALDFTVPQLAKPFAKLNPWSQLQLFALAVLRDIEAVIEMDALFPNERSPANRSESREVQLKRRRNVVEKVRSRLRQELAEEPRLTLEQAERLVEQGTNRDASLRTKMHAEAFVVEFSLTASAAGLAVETIALILSVEPHAIVAILNRFKKDEE
jgi:Sigma-70 region 2